MLRRVAIACPLTLEHFPVRPAEVPRLVAWLFWQTLVLLANRLVKQVSTLCQSSLHLDNCATASRATARSRAERSSVSATLASVSNICATAAVSRILGASCHKIDTDARTKGTSRPDGTDSSSITSRIPASSLRIAWTIRVNARRKSPASTCTGSPVITTRPPPCAHNGGEPVAPEPAHPTAEPVAPNASPSSSFSPGEVLGACRHHRSAKHGRASSPPDRTTVTTAGRNESEIFAGRQLRRSAPHPRSVPRHDAPGFEDLRM